MNKILKQFLLVSLLGASFYMAGQDSEIFKAILDNDKARLFTVLNTQADVNVIENIGPWRKVSPLIAAVHKRNLEFMQMLIQHGASVNYKDGVGASPLFYAASSGNKEMVQLLVDSNADLAAADARGITPLEEAKRSGNPDVVYIIESNLQKKQGSH